MIKLTIELLYYLAKRTFEIFFLLAGICFHGFTQNYPSFQPEIKVSINGLNFDAMEPFITKDGNTLFFNSLNSGGNTNLYYADRIDDSTFQYMGLVNGCFDPSPNHLDGVPSLDSAQNFYWVSLRNYPIQIENLHFGQYANGIVSNLKRVYGNFNVYAQGWLIMDACIEGSGNHLYYVNALFNNCAFGLPCRAQLGVAQKVNDSTFSKLSNSDALFTHINDTNYLVYAPELSADGKELYFTRILNGSLNTEICVAVRHQPTDTFSLPQVIHANLGYVPEAATITGDQQKIYYHQKDNSGLFKIYLRYKNLPTHLDGNSKEPSFGIYPNPAADELKILGNKENKALKYIIISSCGQVLDIGKTRESIDLKPLAKGIYCLRIEVDMRTSSIKFIKE
jgi:hypothetical protein